MKQSLTTQDIILKPTSEIAEELKVLNEIQFEEQSILDSLKQVYGYIPLRSEQERKQKIILGLVDEWFTLKVVQKYPQLSHAIFSYEREVELDVSKAEIVPFRNTEEKLREGTYTTVTIPAFLSASIDEEKWQREFSYSSRSETYKFRLSASVPKIPKEIRADSKKAMALPYKISAEAMETSVLSDVILENPSYAPSARDSQVLVLWKPKTSELKLKIDTIERIDRDPLLVLNWNRPYLVALWTEPYEEPFFDLSSLYAKQTTLDTV